MSVIKFRRRNICPGVKMVFRLDSGISQCTVYSLRMRSSSDTLSILSFGKLLSFSAKGHRKWWHAFWENLTKDNKSTPLGINHRIWNHWTCTLHACLCKNYKFQYGENSAIALNLNQPMDEATWKTTLLLCEYLSLATSHQVLVDE